MDALRSLPLWPHDEIATKITSGRRKFRWSFVMYDNFVFFENLSRVLRTNSHTKSRFFSFRLPLAISCGFLRCSWARTCFRFHITRFSLSCFFSNFSNVRQTGQSRQKKMPYKICKMSKTQTLTTKMVWSKPCVMELVGVGETRKIVSYMRTISNTKEKLINA